MTAHAPWAQVPVVPVVVIHDANTAIGLGQALLAGGVNVVEVTLRTPAAIESIRRLRDEVPDLIVGAGTVMTPPAVQAASAAGAHFLVSPGTTASLRTAMRESGLPCLPGAGSLSEAMDLQEAGFTAIKLFPISQLGGPPFVRAVASVLPDLSVCPTGGLKAATAAEMLALPSVACVGGSWVASTSDISQRDWDGITARAADTHQLRPASSHAEKHGSEERQLS